MSVGHLARRFFGSLDKRPISQGDIEWVRAQLSAGEWELWKRYSFPDRRHTVDVAREAARRLGDDATHAVVAAALLHDIGKTETALGTFERVVATLIGKRLQRGNRLRDYWDNNEVGARMLSEAGSDPLTVAWAREHELPRGQWTLPPHIAEALYAADNR